MRRGARFRVMLGFAMLGSVTLAALARGLQAGGSDELATRVADLESQHFEARRRAERAIYLEGLSVLAALEAGDEGVDARVAAFDRVLLTCEGKSTPASARAAARIATRLEASATDDQVRRIPRLLRVRLDRVLPLVVIDRTVLLDRAESARVDSRAVRGLMPEARLDLLDRVRTTDDPRALAGAVASLCSESGDGVEDEADLAVIGSAWQKSPGRFADVGRYESVDGAPPIVAVALSLALTGRARDLFRLLRNEAPSSSSLRTWLEPRLKARAEGDLTMGAFLTRVEEGRTTAAIETEAARRALDGSMPWFARLLARRALFLEPSSTEATRILAVASEAVGIHSDARRDGKPAEAATPVDGTRADDPSAVAMDDALRAGRLSQRLVHQIEAGSDLRYGMLAMAIGGGRIVHATADGTVRVVDAATAKESVRFGRPPRRGTASLAIRGDEVAEVTNRGAVALFALDGSSANLEREEPTMGASALAAGAKGFWVVGPGLTIRRLTKDGVESFEKVKPIDRFVVRTLGVFPDDSLLVASRETAWRIDPASGRSTRVEPPSEPALVSTCGDDVLAAHGDAFVRLDRAGRQTGGGRIPDGGEIKGLAAESNGSTAYLQTVDALYAVDPADGHVRWVEHLEGSGDPIVGGGLVAARAGTGSMSQGGDGREDRTMYVLRAAATLTEPFGVPERARIVALATAAASEGKAGVVRALVDPVRSWLSVEEAEAIELVAAAAERTESNDGRKPFEPPADPDPTRKPGGR